MRDEGMRVRNEGMDTVPILCGVSECKVSSSCPQQFLKSKKENGSGVLCISTACVEIKEVLNMVIKLYYAICHSSLLTLFHVFYSAVEREQ